MGLSHRTGFQPYNLVASQPGVVTPGWDEAGPLARRRRQEDGSQPGPEAWLHYPSWMSSAPSLCHFPSANGASYPSLGHRPRKYPQTQQGLKARNIRMPQSESHALHQLASSRGHPNPTPKPGIAPAPTARPISAWGTAPGNTPKPNQG